ncbi:TIR domain-containing protein [Duganella sp. HH105]|uniref:TIR domain-containing protein n=1 Tax=Duganella sp. HH105 TaxID=1781067 RepID=UPI001E58DEA4|nr:TIR domain-containing protein [Duganella sp. HH105]
MSVKEAYDTDWKTKVRTRIRRSNGVIVLVSKNSAASSGQKWEIECAREEDKKILGIWAYKDDRSVIAGRQHTSLDLGGNYSIYRQSVRFYGRAKYRQTRTFQ